MAGPWPEGLAEVDCAVVAEGLAGVEHLVSFNVCRLVAHWAGHVVHSGGPQLHGVARMEATVLQACVLCALVWYMVSCT